MLIISSFFLENKLENRRRVIFSSPDSFFDEWNVYITRQRSVFVDSRFVGRSTTTHQVAAFLDFV